MRTLSEEKLKSLTGSGAMVSVVGKPKRKRRKKGSVKTVQSCSNTDVAQSIESVARTLAYAVDKLKEASPEPVDEWDVYVYRDKNQRIKSLKLSANRAGKSKAILRQGGQR